MNTYKVYTYTSSGAGTIDTVVASTKHDAKLFVLLRLGESRKYVVRQVAELEEANSHQNLTSARTA